MYLNWRVFVMIRKPYSKTCIDLYRIYPKFCDRRALTNNKTPDQTPQNVTSDRALHCLPLTQHTASSLMDLFSFITSKGLKCQNI